MPLPLHPLPLPPQSPSDFILSPLHSSSSSAPPRSPPTRGESGSVLCFFLIFSNTETDPTRRFRIGFGSGFNQSPIDFDQFSSVEVRVRVEGREKGIQIDQRRRLHR